MNSSDLGVVEDVFRNFTSRNITTSPTPPVDSVYHLRLALTVTHLTLVALGTVNLLVIALILLRPYMRSITNVYMIGLCLADFIYLANLTVVAAAQLNNRSWPFGMFMCSLSHGSETTGKYASVLFVVLLAADRYCAMCKASWCARYRNYRTAICASIVAWLLAGLFATPLYAFATIMPYTLRNDPKPRWGCIAHWPNSKSARWYISMSSIVIFVLPLALIVFCYYHILNKLQEALKGSKRMKRASASRAPYHRVTRLVLWVVVFHIICWSPFWLFNLFVSIFSAGVKSQFERIVINIIHLFPYVNCALNPLLYAVHAENFRVAFRSLFCRSTPPGDCSDAIHKTSVTRSTVYRTSNAFSTACPTTHSAVYVATNGAANGQTNTILVATVGAKDRNHSVCAQNPPTNVLLALPCEYSPMISSGEESADGLTVRSESISIARVGPARMRESLSSHSHARYGRSHDRLPVDTSGWRKYSEVEAELGGRSLSASSANPSFRLSPSSATHSVTVSTNELAPPRNGRSTSLTERASNASSDASSKV